MVNGNSSSTEKSSTTAGESPSSIYKDRIHTIDRGIKDLNKKDIPLAILKLIILAAGLVFLFLTITRPSHRHWPHFSIALGLFIAAAVIHERVLQKKKHLQRVRSVNENEIKSLNHEFLDVDCGEAFADPAHPYTADLDIFGQRSLFHYINRANTRSGIETLAHWLSTHRDIETIGRRQEAISELRENTVFRQNIQALGMTLQNTPQRRDFIKGLFDRPDLVSGNRWLTAAIFSLPPVTLAAVVLVFFGWPWQLPAGFFLLQLLINGLTAKGVSRLYGLTGKTAKALSAYAGIMFEICRQDFSSRCLTKIKQALYVNERCASKWILRLSSLVEWLDLRLSAVHFLFNNILCWDLHLVRKIEAWKRETGEFVHGWFEAMGRTEALVSLANLYFNHPRWTMPEICSPPFKLTADSLGHPLIPGEERVDNDMKIESGGKICIITGPNMAGKSTFLRTVGVNMVLAQAGAPVCATRFLVSSCRVYTSMKISDSLDRGLSLFYAELQRLKMILEAISRSEPVFFIIDEMLKGTNTLDRQQGARAMIGQLIRHRTDGLLATHDLALSQLTEKFPENIINYYFDGEIRDDRLFFDYKLRSGFCRSSNALALMRKIGIEI